MKSILIILFTSLAPLLALGAAVQPGPSSVHFVVIGDRTGQHVPGVYEQAVAEIERLQPDFVITVGDQIEGYTTDTAQLNKEWDEYLNIVRPLTMPLIITPGNHDITYDPAQAVFESRAAAPYRSFDINGVHFIILDNSRWESSANLPPAEMEWLEHDLTTHPATTRTFVFMHKPFWYDTTAKGKPDTLHTLFVKYGVNAVFTGHYHEYFSGTYDGIRYTSVGSSGGAMNPNDPSGLGYHFAWVTIGKDSLIVSPIKLGGVQSWNVLSAEDFYAAQKVEGEAVAFESPAMVGEDLTIAQAPVYVVVHNQTTTAVRDTVQWDTPIGWSISPSMEQLTIPPNGNTRFKVTIQASGNLYPLPTLALNLPFKEGRTMKLISTLPIARQIQCDRATDGITIDGNLSEKSWKNPATRYFSDDGKDPKAESTSVYFTYDAGNLYVAAKCQESKLDSLRAKVTDRDGAISSDDCLGLYLQPRIKSDTAYQIYFNALGTVADARMATNPEDYYDRDRSWNGTYEVKATRGNGYWTVEAKIPLAQFGINPVSGMQMGLNFIRKQQRLQEVVEWQAPLDYNPSTYGRMTLR